jgi:hypothetical protein
MAARSAGGTQGLDFVPTAQGDAGKFIKKLYASTTR